MAFQTLLYKPLAEYLKNIEDLFSMDLYQVSNLVSITDEESGKAIKNGDKHIREIVAVVRDFRIDLKQISRTRNAVLRVNEIQLHEIYISLDRTIEYIIVVKKLLEITRIHMVKAIKQINEILAENNLKDFIEIQAAPITNLINKMNMILTEHKAMEKFIKTNWGKKKYKYISEIDSLLSTKVKRNPGPKPGTKPKVKIAK